MTKQELVENTRAALEDFDLLPDDEQIREMVRWGTINERGEVLMGGESEVGHDR